MKKNVLVFLVAASFGVPHRGRLDVLRPARAATRNRPAGQKELLTALARAAPMEDGDAGRGSTRRQKGYPNLHLLYMRGIPGVDEVEVFTRNVELQALWNARQEDAAFKHGIEAAAYLETYVMPEAIRLGAAIRC